MTTPEDDPGDKARRTPPGRGGVIRVNGFAFRALRVMAGLNTRPCADAIGISRPYLARIELGQRPNVGPEVFAAMVRVLALPDRRALLADPYGEPPPDTPDEDPDDPDDPEDEDPRA